MSEIDVARYCREIETYLCRKNLGHLIRIVGPAFDQVSGWAARGVPLQLAFRGIDRCCERYYAKGARRRPVRIEFCEADILELFDDWRRAVGVVAADRVAEAAPRRDSLAAHLARVKARFTELAAAGSTAPGLAREITGAVEELDRLGQEAGSARGERRAEIVGRLARLEDDLTDVILKTLSPPDIDRLRREAETELAPFAGRMARDAYAGSFDAAYRRLAREQAGLPTVRYE